MAEELVPSILFIGLTIVLVMMFYFRYRAKQDIQATIQL